MATTTKFDVSPLVPGCLALSDAFWDRIGGKEASRWGGIRNPRWECWTFSIRLPRDIGEAWELLGRCEAVGYTAGNRTGSALFTVEKRLRTIIGWPCDPATSHSDEDSFRGAIIGAPRDLAGWCAYSDWLTEQGSVAGYTIAEWLNPKQVSQTERKKAAFQIYYAAFLASRH